LCSILIMFPTSTAQRSELRLLTWVDDFCNEQILRRLSTRGTGSDPEDLKELAKEMGAMFAASLTTTFQKITASQEALAANVQNSVMTQHNELIALRNAIAQAAHEASGIEARLSQLPQTVIEQLNAVPMLFNRLAEEMGGTFATSLATTFKPITEGQEELVTK